MLFNSLEFLIFFPVVTVLYFALPTVRSRQWLLVVASTVFYMAFIPAYVLILYGTIVVDYFAGLKIERASGRSRRLWLAASICANVGCLAVFKYCNFVIANTNEILSLVHNASRIPLVEMTLPVGLSFHTFQAMSYTIEVYRGKQKAERSFLVYALYVMFYPQLVAGPIERPQNIIHQLKEKHSFDPERVAHGLRFILWGFFKKVVVADRLALIVNAVYASPQHYSGPVLAIATVAFAIQIYADFSG
jgi:D-alanyl-lipoteichoic acid acyltransferase DltB (MBOAT superfamily)